MTAPKQHPVSPTDPDKLYNLRKQSCVDRGPYDGWLGERQGTASSKRERYFRTFQGGSLVFKGGKVLDEWAAKLGCVAYEAKRAPKARRGKR